MASLTEQLQEDTPKKIKEAVDITAKTAKRMGKGIALILENTVLSEKSIMKALDKKLEKTGDIRYSHKNVSIEELQKSGRVERVDELMLQESMRYFDKYCREFGVKYSALKTKQLGEDGTEREGYMIFFEGRNDKLIEDIMRRAVADWTKDQSLMKAAKEAGKDTAKAAAEVAKPSVLAKLAFFRNRAKESVNAETDRNKDKNAERTRQPDLER